jgi:S1-C subfamily serine protease
MPGFPWKSLLSLPLAATLALALVRAAGGDAALPARQAPFPAGSVSGSGFLVAPGRMVTNSHVVQACRQAGTPIDVARLPGPWQVVFEDPTSDLALLAGPETAAAEILPLSAAPGLARGAPVLALGYAAQAEAGQAPGALLARVGQVVRATLSIHNAEAGRSESFVLRDRTGREIVPTWEDGVRFFGAARESQMRWLVEVDIPAAPGTSGGPVLDAAGSVVGVVQAGDRQRGASGVIPSEDLRDFLRRAGVAAQLRTRSAAAPPDWRGIEAAAGRKAHRILC